MTIANGSASKRTATRLAASLNAAARGLQDFFGAQNGQEKSAGRWLEASTERTPAASVADAGARARGNRVIGQPDFRVGSALEHGVTSRLDARAS